MIDAYLSYAFSFCMFTFGRSFEAQEFVCNVRKCNRNLTFAVFRTSVFSTVKHSTSVSFVTYHFEVIFTFFFIGHWPQNASHSPHDLAENLDGGHQDKEKQTRIGEDYRSRNLAYLLLTIGFVIFFVRYQVIVLFAIVIACYFVCQTDCALRLAIFAFDRKQLPLGGRSRRRWCAQPVPLAICLTCSFTSSLLSRIILT